MSDHLKKIRPDAGELWIAYASSDERYMNGIMVDDHDYCVDCERHGHCACDHDNKILDDAVAGD